MAIGHHSDAGNRAVLSSVPAAKPLPIGLIYILCHASDVWLAKICAASVRYWYPELRITLLKDLTAGPFDTTELERYWNLDVLVLPNARCGRGFAKIELLLRTRRERFLVLDADTVVCGPVLRKLELLPQDFVLSQRDVADPHAEWFLRTFFDVDLLAKLDPAFVFPGVAFNSGVFVGSSGVLTREMFEPHCVWGSPVRLRDPHIFSGSDQGILNYVLLKGAAQGRIQVASADFMIWGFSKAATQLRWERIARGRGYESVLHFAGRKPASIIEFPAAEILLGFDRLYHSRLR